MLLVSDVIEIAYNSLKNDANCSTDHFSVQRQFSSDFVDLLLSVSGGKLVHGWQ